MTPADVAEGSPASDMTTNESVHGPAMNNFQVAVLASQRARQLQNGARPRVDVADHKLLRLAVLEVMAGLVSWHVTESPGAAPAQL